MNGVICLGHFCETHGPCVVLSTQAITGATRPPEHPAHVSASQECAACKSLDANTALVSDHGTVSYVTTRMALKQETAFLLRQACVRSLSCEEETGSEGGSVYFGDCERGHVLSYTFRLSDSLARGFQRLYTVIVLMRDRVHLLNSWPFLTSHIRRLTQHLESKAERVNRAEQNERSQRVRRVASGVSNGSARSLAQLTGLPDVCSHVHSWFAWILAAGARAMTERTNETVGNGPPLLCGETDEGFTLVQFGRKTPPTETCCSDSAAELRRLHKEMGRDKFKVVCYCVSIGLQVVVRGPELITTPLLNALSLLQPKNWLRVVFQSAEYLNPEACDLLGIGVHVAVPTPNEHSLRLDVLQNDLVIKWTSTLPEKLPTFLTKLLRAIEDERIGDPVLSYQIQVLVEEWSNIVQAVLWAQDHDHPNKTSALARSLGVQQCDSILIQRWIQKGATHLKNLSV